MLVVQGCMEDRLQVGPQVDRTPSPLGGSVRQKRGTLRTVGGATGRPPGWAEPGHGRRASSQTGRRTGWTQRSPRPCAASQAPSQVCPAAGLRALPSGGLGVPAPSTAGQVPGFSARGIREDGGAPSLLHTNVQLAAATGLPELPTGPQTTPSVACGPAGVPERVGFDPREPGSDVLWKGVTADVTLASPEQAGPDVVRWAPSEEAQRHKVPQRDTP